MTTPRAIILGSVLLAITLAILFRYAVAPGMLYDRWSGRVIPCTWSDQNELATLKAAGFTDPEISDWATKPHCR